jgi:hypothetical protein
VGAQPDINPYFSPQEKMLGSKRQKAAFRQIL